MKNVLSISFAIVCSMFCLKSTAQIHDKTWNLSLGFQGGIPLGGEIHPFYGFEDGIDLRLSRQLGPGFATLSCGANVYIPTKSKGFGVAAIQIPLLMGYKYEIASPYFVTGELGYSMFASRYGTGNGVSETAGGFTYAYSMGRNFGSFDFAVRYEGILVKGTGSPTPYNIGHVDLRLRVYF
jgi:hypothetical protein